MISSVFHNHSGLAYSRPSPSIAPAAPAGNNADPASKNSTSEARLRAAAINAATPGASETEGTSTPGAQTANTAGPGAPGEAPASDQANNTPSTAANQDDDTNEQGLTEAEQREVQELRERDREVRAHEQAHLAAAGQYARGGIQYTYERGPDSRMYAVGGQVSVDTSKVPGDPEATLRKAETLRRAALAPAEPSSQDRSVAAEMTRMAADARQDMAEASREDAQQTAEDVAKRGADAEEPGAGAEPLSCPSCGGRHSAQAHDGMVAYTAPSRTTAGSVATV
ncbi:MAG: putative metalloprotease CJM1_0395 family protein [Pseudomonadota bacterium]